MSKSTAKHVPTGSQRRQVGAMAGYGIPETDIACAIGIDPKTLRKHYRDELDRGHVKATAQVAGFLFEAARKGNVTACIFWLKTRAGWSEYGPSPPGKKAAALAAALEHDPDTELGRLMARRAAHSH